MCGLTASLLLLPPAARGGSWAYTITGDNTGSTVSGAGASLTPYSPAATGTGSSASIPTYQMELSIPGTGSSISLTVHAQVTFTWKPATGQTLATDPPPPNVLVVETSSATWWAGGGNAQHIPKLSGVAADGLSDAEYKDPSKQDANDGAGTSASPSGPTLVGAHLTSYPASSGTVTIFRRTLTASSTLSYPATNPYYSSTFASIDSYTASIHPQPYNYHRVPGASVKGNDGTIDWTYGYSSTDGNTNDLTSCYWHEYLTYQGTVGTVAKPNKYYPPDPPFNYPTSGSYFNNPDVFPVPGNSMAQTPANALEYDITKVPSFVAPALYTYGTYTVTQLFEFDDTATGQTNVPIPGPGSGPFAIVRTVKYLDATHYQYSVTKDSVPNTLLLPD